MPDLTRERWAAVPCFAERRGEECWCACIATEAGKDSDDMETCVVPYGSVSKENASRIVEAHNATLGLDLAEIESLTADLARLRDQADAAQARAEAMEGERDAIIRRVLAEKGDRPGWGGIYGWLAKRYGTYDEAVAAVRREAGLDVPAAAGQGGDQP